MDPPQEQLRERPVVAIVGRPNVGKSALFNRLAGRRIAIVHDQPGVTRDRISTTVEAGSAPFEIMDTGGIGAALDDGFAEQVAAEVDIAVETSDVILFVVDGAEGRNAIDEALAVQLRRSGKPVMLVVNKIDSGERLDLVTDFAGLGFAETVGVSAAHGLGCGELHERLEARLAEVPVRERAGAGGARGGEPIKVAVIGCPNAGKSSLINAMLRDDRTIVSEMAGTTRDAVDIPYRIGSTHYTLIDTAGMRRRTKIDSTVELFSVMRAENSIRRSDLCALVVDVARGVTAQDRRIARMICDHHKPCVIVGNKFDLFHPGGAYRDRIAELDDQLRRELFFLHYAPVVGVSALEKENVGRVFRAIERVQKESRAEINTGRLNRVLADALQRNPPPVRRNRRLKILYAAHARDAGQGPIPVPHYILFINESKLLTNNYLRYLERKLREEEPFVGLPVRLTLRSREKKGKR